MTEVSVYRRSEPFGSPICQGEIFSNVFQFRLKIESITGTNLEIERDIHDYVIVLSQDCDLEQDFHRPLEKRQLKDILFCSVKTAADLATRINNSNIWQRVSQNKDERYHFLQTVPISADLEEIGLPELGIDFKNYFTIPATEFYKRLEIGEIKRRTVPLSPYMEQISDRFTYFLGRVALPQPHSSE